jgi:hypothetical protein
MEEVEVMLETILVVVEVQVQEMSLETMRVG